MCLLFVILVALTTTTVSAHCTVARSLNTDTKLVTPRDPGLQVVPGCNAPLGPGSPGCDYTYREITHIPDAAWANCSATITDM